MFPLLSIRFLRSRDPLVLLLMKIDSEANRKVDYQLINFLGRYNSTSKLDTLFVVHASHNTFL
jgi:hypothetical protein